MNIKIYSQPVIPSAKRLITSLRDIGYDFSAAVADLIDNSITAGANEIILDVEFDGDHSWVRIVDNGAGMSKEQLLEAMRYGSEKEYSNDDLGKFGLGLKTASLSQCHKLTVLTKSLKAGISAYCWDLEHIEKVNRWELLIPSEKEVDKILGENLINKTGTIVHWQFLDRLLGQKHPYGEASRKRLVKMCRELEEHISMVFHRFLNNEVKEKNLKIILNGNELVAWDPFAREEPETKWLKPVTLKLERNNISGSVELNPFILPPRDKFSSSEAFNLASGPNKWNFQQGFYIYRANRLIQSGGWCNLRVPDEHTKLARIGLDFPPNLDEAFNINVAKMRVQLPQEIKEDISELVEEIVKEARKVYDKKDRPISLNTTKKQTQATKKGNQSVNREYGSSESEDKSKQGYDKLWTIDEIQKQLMRSAYSDEAPIVAKVFKRLRKKLSKGE